MPREGLTSIGAANKAEGARGADTVPFGGYLVLRTAADRFASWSM